MIRTGQSSTRDAVDGPCSAVAGRGPDAPSLRSAPADLQSLSSRTRDWELLIIIGYGVMCTPMHGYRNLLTAVANFLADSVSILLNTTIF